MKRNLFYLILLGMIGLTVSCFAEDGVNLLENKTGKTVIKRVSIKRNYGTTFLIISRSGTVIVADPYMMPKGIKPDIITVTHGHFDHYDTMFVTKAIKNPDVKYSYAGSLAVIDYKNVRVTSVPSSHDSGYVSKTEPSNVLYVYEVDGLRIVHMGDIGQESLSPDQMRALGKIDIAFMQLVNSYSGMSLENGKGFKLIEQFRPQVVIPTHASPEAVKKLGEKYGDLLEIQDVWAVSADDLKDGKTKVIDLK